MAEARVGRLATVRSDGRPHVVPCCFALHLDLDRLFTAVDDVKPKSTRALRRLDNIADHPQVSLLIDFYDEDWSRLWWVRVDGSARVAPPGSADATVGVLLLAAKYEQYRRQPPPGPVTVVDLEHWVAWP